MLSVNNALVPKKGERPSRPWEWPVTWRVSSLVGLLWVLCMLSLLRLLHVLELLCTHVACVVLLRCHNCCCRLPSPYNSTTIMFLPQLRESPPFLAISYGHNRLQILSVYA